MPIRLPQLGTVSTPQMSSVRMPGVSPRPPRLEMPVSDMRISARDMAAPFAALAQFGGQLAGVGDRLGSIAMDVKQLERRNTLDDIDLTAKEIFGQLEIDAANDPDPKNLLAKYDSAAGKLQESLLSKDMDPATRREAENRMAALSQAYKVRFATSAATGMIAQEKGRTDHNYNRYMALGEYDKAKELIASTPESILPSHKKEEALWKTEMAQSDMEAVKFLTADPRSGRKWLDERDENGTYKNAPNIPFERRQQLLGHAEREINRENADFADSLIARMNKDDMPTSAEVIAAQEAGKLDPRSATALLSRIEAESPPADDPELVADTIRRIEAFDPQRDYAANDAERTAILQTIATEFSPARQQTLLGRFNQKIKGEPISEYAGRIREYLDQGFDKGMFGQFKRPGLVDTVDEDGQPVKRPGMITVPGEKDKAFSRYLQTLEQVDQFLLSPEARKMPTAELFRNIQKMLPRDPEQSRGATSILGGGRDPLARMNSLFGEDSPAPAPRLAMNPQAGQSTATFGGVAIAPLGEDWTDVEGTVFGGKTDPVDSGIGAFGLPTGPGGLEGVAMPQSVMDSYGATNKSDYGRFRVLVRNGSRQAVFPIVDRGTAESVVEKAGNMKLDLTEGAVAAIGGKVTYDTNGKQAGTTGIGSLQFSVVKLPDTAQWSTLPWDAVRKQILREAGDASESQLRNTLVVARNEWLAIRAAAGK